MIWHEAERPVTAYPEEEKTERDHMNRYKYQRSVRKTDSVVPSDRTRGNGHRLKYRNTETQEKLRKFKHKKKTFFRTFFFCPPSFEGDWTLTNRLNICPGKLWNLCPWRYSNICMEIHRYSWVNCSRCDCLVRWAGLYGSPKILSNLSCSVILQQLCSSTVNILILNLQYQN